MAETSLSLLDRLRAPGSPAGAWQRLVDLYTPLLHRWLRPANLQPSDVDDLVQEVLAVVVRKIPEFRHDGRAGSFRAWLRTITVRRLGDYWRGRYAAAPSPGPDELGRMLAELEDPHGGLSRLWDEEHDRYVLERLVELIEPEFKPATWAAFRGHVIEGRSADAVAAELGVTPNVVFIAKSRVMHRLREEARGLIDDHPSLS
jgi:RNA polymerase sigma-70 factor (ECF subfamily)